jgi:hypothetical protein
MKAQSWRSPTVRTRQRIETWLKTKAAAREGGAHTHSIALAVCRARKVESENEIGIKFQVVEP